MAVMARARGVVSVHSPVRPDWTCAAGCVQWPCPTRRRQLLAEFTESRRTLGLVMASMLVRACADMPEASAGGLYDQFLGWIRGGSAEGQHHRLD